MGERYPRWTYVVIFALLAIVVALAARALRDKKSDAVRSEAPAEKSAASADKDRQIADLGGEVADLRKTVEQNAARVKELESRLDETHKALASAQQKLKTAQKQTEKAAATAAARERSAVKTAASPPQPSVPPRRPVESATYEIVRDTAVLERPSSSAREVALIQRGTTINVVGAQGDWLEVRSKYGKPPGFVRREDAILKQAQNDR